MESTYPHILYVSLWPWEALWQRPQQLAQQLSGRYNVIYTSAIPFHAAAGAPAGALKNWWHLKKRRESERLSVLDFFLVPSWRFTSIRSWNHRKWAATVAEYVKQQNITVDILWLSSPEHLPFCQQVRSRLVCYDCMDNYTSFFPKLLPLEKELFRRADVTFVSAAALEEKARQYTDKVYLIPNGVETEHFRTSLETPYPLPADMKDIPSPRIGYYGTIEEWLDYELLEELHKKTGLSIVLIGPVRSKKAQRLARTGQVFLLGPKPYRDLPVYLAHFSVCILPFRDTELTRAVDPVKVYEYLAAGRDVIATPLPALSRHKGIITQASPADFCEAVCAALGRQTPLETRREWSAAMSVHSWGRRAGQIQAVLDSSFISPAAGKRRYYEAWHHEQASRRDDGSVKQSVRQLLKPFRYFTAKRERLFRRVFKKRKKGLILDIACGTGQAFYKEFGPVIGVDLSLNALTLLQRRGLYEKVVHADAGSLPFPDRTFDYVVSADFFGHVSIPEKDKVISEMSRVLTPGGIMAHVIETDSVNLFFRFAHTRPDLFQKYFVEQIGGHYGLELPSETMRRFQNCGFRILEVHKMWGPVWETREYARQFANEYAAYSRMLRLWVGMCRLLSSNPVSMLGADALLGVTSSLVDRFQSLDHAQGIFLVAQKKG